jgi:hypothetical protein
MNVHELSREQIDELKQSYLTEKMDAEGETPSYGELADAPQDITDEEIFERYEGTEFSNDDFVCSCENLPSKSFETYIMEGSRGKFLHINADPSGDGTWFDWTPSVFEAYYHDLDQLQEIARCEFSDFEEGYPKFHKVRFSFEKIETV